MSETDSFSDEALQKIRALSEALGNSIEETQALLERSLENHRRISGCARHAFWKAEPPSLSDGLDLGRVHCASCGGWLTMPETFSYRSGYLAAGGDPNDLVADVTVN